ncbi:MAG: DUF4258 domain-containing protein [Caldilinea sp.]|nr:DUF4258 domain-containing protein [Caldilinea sp.]MCB0146949.1 DUF4258 domain-containing protein [Caldilineaceae bacterium]MCO5210716.1 DUF4258 domain-containing protein [Caldilinea sp.]MCW5843416.1 DUF4258 domain-containing protein [Caldilinea sp.]HRW51129.1 DUF4258 domain-containing protein [Caldilinea sp.]
MTVKFTLHASRRMVQRRVSEQVVLDTIDSPDDIVIGEMGESIAIRRHLRDEIRVVYEENPDGVYVVFTVIRTRISEQGDD